MSPNKVGLDVRGLHIRRESLSWCYDFQIASGQILAVMGESGCGKSTLLDTLGGFYPADQGQIILGKQCIQTLDIRLRPVSTLFQQYNLFEHLSVEQNLKLGFSKASPTAIQWQQVEQALALLGVQEQLKRKPSLLSGGQRQRIALIRVMLREQPIVLLDEPFSALDAQTRKLCGNWVKQICQEQQKIVLMVTHEAMDAEAWADQTLWVQPLQRTDA
ncbi:hypothetical protein DN062_05770 [Nitrincola tibetensis]|uniref:ABC transporter domain-containing protein n=1 Tax=Nitrincola tibetensis TaxID=2219697 RepID=A0A364NPE8_9GAMM|nr:ATP-binding cassette domain-containing protein [Nitrincola tibetensis]RAU18978.1 hypothetical protein DN062_05770 [Nitrincola tibetensis]